MAGTVSHRSDELILMCAIIKSKPMTYKSTETQQLVLWIIIIRPGCEGCRCEVCVCWKNDFDSSMNIVTMWMRMMIKVKDYYLFVILCMLSDSEGAKLYLSSFTLVCLCVCRLHWCFAFIEQFYSLKCNSIDRECEWFEPNICELGWSYNNTRKEKINFLKAWIE